MAGIGKQKTCAMCKVPIFRDGAQKEPLIGGDWGYKIASMHFCSYSCMRQMNERRIQKIRETFARKAAEKARKSIDNDIRSIDPTEITPEEEDAIRDRAHELLTCEMKATASTDIVPQPEQSQPADQPAECEPAGEITKAEMEILDRLLTDEAARILKNTYCVTMDELCSMLDEVNTVVGLWKKVCTDA